MFDTPRVRGLYSSLADGWIYLNAQDFPQIPERVSSAAARSFRIAPLLERQEASAGQHSRQPQLGRRVGESFIDAARTAIADLTGARKECVIVGPSRASLLDNLATALSRRLRLGEEVVLSRIDDPANITPWKRAADLYGAKVRWAEADLGTGALPAWQFTELIGSQTSVVAVSAANRLVGTVTNVRAISETVRTKSDALLVVDVNSYAPYRPVVLDELGADVVALDISSLGGPSVGALVFRDQKTLRSLVPYFMAKDVVRGPSLEEARALLEIGGVSEGLLGAVPEAVDHLAVMDDEARGTRRRRVRTGLPQLSQHLNALARRAVEGLQSLGTVHVIGVDGDAVNDDGEHGVHGSFDAVDRVPRFAFMVDGVPAPVVEERLLASGIVTGVVRPGESVLLSRMGVFEDATLGGAVAVGLAPHNTAHDVDHMVRAVASLR
ncbi:aminotransferase class V-fold PLP-dependent enzyme [uncultured Corynebacterium sp.]|uniref:aminotransferase class V-fold PLP-dependent enzyme n=1 Tax=uncultured Corynebacterium sp. TaxID=159447 RepID=UPI0025E4B3FD|nr:aminotransferase class V-fold PLP-dependent enzyme [uncultured Corynebacterium sp.]